MSVNSPRLIRTKKNILKNTDYENSHIINFVIKVSILEEFININFLIKRYNLFLKYKIKFYLLISIRVNLNFKIDAYLFNF